MPRGARGGRRATLALALLSASCLAWARTTVLDTGHVRAELVADARAGIAPGKPVTLGLLLTHRPGWHTYWINPGDSGLPTTLDWTLPDGVAAGPIAWPVPRRLPSGPLVDFGYEGQVLLSVPVRVSAAAANQPLQLRLHAQWLACREQCLAEAGDFALTLAARVPARRHAALFDATRAALPRPRAGVRARARVTATAITLEVSGLPAALRARQLDVFIEQGGVVDYAAAVMQRGYGAHVTLRLPMSAQHGALPAALSAVLAVHGQDGGIRIGFPTTPERGPNPHTTRGMQ